MLSLWLKNDLQKLIRKDPINWGILTCADPFCTNQANNLFND